MNTALRGSDGLVANARRAAANLIRKRPLRAGRRHQLVSFDAAIGGLGISGQSQVGVRAIPISSIIGSLDRAAAFDHRFRPRTLESRSRITSLRRAFPNGSFPAISVYQIGGAYFVSDGHHRVALARKLGMAYIDADIIRIRTRRKAAPKLLRPAVAAPECAVASGAR